MFAIIRLVRKPLQPERLYVDFDGFFAACEEQAEPRLRGRPIGVVPFADAVHSCVIAANALAKRDGVRTVPVPRIFQYLKCPSISTSPADGRLTLSSRWRCRGHLTKRKNSTLRAIRMAARG